MTQLNPLLGLLVARLLFTWQTVVRLDRVALSSGNWTQKGPSMATAAPSLTVRARLNRFRPCARGRSGGRQCGSGMAWLGSAVGVRAACARIRANLQFLRVPLSSNWPLFGIRSCCFSVQPVANSCGLATKSQSESDHLVAKPCVGCCSDRSAHAHGMLDLTVWHTVFVAFRNNAVCQQLCNEVWAQFARFKNGIIVQQSKRLFCACFYTYVHLSF